MPSLQDELQKIGCAYLSKIAKTGADEKAIDALEEEFRQDMLNLAKKHVGEDLAKLGMDVRLKKTGERGPAGRFLYELEIFNKEKP